MENSDINIRLDDLFDIKRSKYGQNRDIYSMIEALRNEIKDKDMKQQDQIFELKTQIKDKHIKQQDRNIEFKRQITNLESKVCLVK